VNDDKRVSTWQDEDVNDQDLTGAAGPGAVAGAAEDGPRQVTEVETLKALADPVRLAILTTLMTGRRAGLPVMSVKELAARLGEPQTKLYRHVKQLETAGLIHVAASRLVSGILEQRYQASQRDLMFGPGLLRDQEPDESQPVVAALMDQYRDGFFAAHRAGLLGSAHDPSGSPDRKGIMAITETRVPAGQAASVAIRLQQIMDEINAMADPDPEDPDAVLIHVMIGCYSTPGDA
jgi:DNA-binding transcriptional ArsR family regulator